jgi:2,4-dienoyl-CoA reductase (NADPH2)
LNTQATLDVLKPLAVDEVIVATGAERNMPDIVGGDRDFVFSGDEMRALLLSQPHPHTKRKTSAFTRFMVSAGAKTGITKNPQLVRQGSKLWLPLGRRIVIIGAELVGLELAEFLAERGREVTVIGTASRAGAGLYLVRRLRLLEELHELGVTLLSRASDIAIEDQQVSYCNYRGQRRSVDADHVVVAAGAKGNTELAEQLRAAGFTTHTIGDCNGVGYIEGALESAAELAVRLG